jgi:hypothetical protein
MYGAHDVRVETVPDARLVEPTDALLRVVRWGARGARELRASSRRDA